MGTRKNKIPSIDIGISAGDRKKIVDGLSALLADSYTLYLMTHNFHWNVTGPQFNSLHQLFIGQYTEQWNALESIAERNRAVRTRDADRRTRIELRQVRARHHLSSAEANEHVLDWFEHHVQSRQRVVVAA